MNQVKDVMAFLEEVAPLHYQEPYDNAGLLTGDPSWEVTGVLTCLDSTEEVVVEAIEKRANMIISHHPIIFGGIKTLADDSYVARAIIRAIKHDIAIYAIHTNLDNVLYQGVNERIAKQLDLQEIELLRPRDTPEVGSGAVGFLSHPLDHAQFVAHLKDRLQLDVIKATKPLARDIRKVALCGGAGRHLLPDALSRGADAFISADFKYHEYFDADGRITIFDIGHYESERFTIDLLCDLIKGNFAKFAAYCTKVNTNPVNYT